MVDCCSSIIFLAWLDTLMTSQSLRPFLIQGIMSMGSYPRPVKYKIRGDKRNKPCLLCDGINTKTPLVLHIIASFATTKGPYFSACQERRRKEIERDLGVSLSCWCHLVLCTVYSMQAASFEHILIRRLSLPVLESAIRLGFSEVCIFLCTFQIDHKKNLSFLVEACSCVLAHGHL